MFSRELDLLEIRLTELDAVIDRFVIVEAPITFRGERKHLYYGDNSARFSEWSRKIRHVVVNDLPDGDDPWLREHTQRSAIARGLDGTSNDDILVVSDADEIPSVNAVRDFCGGGISRLALRQYRYFLNYFYPFRWDNGRICTIDDYRGVTHPQGIRYVYDGTHCIPDAGWHFSYLGGRQEVLRKVHDFSHCHDPETPEFIAKVKNATGWLDVDHDLQPSQVDETFPSYVRDHQGELFAKGLLGSIIEKKEHDRLVAKSI